MFAQLLANENTKNMRRIILWVELAITAVLVIFINFILYITLQSAAPGQDAIPAEARELFLQSLTWPSGLLQSLSFAASNALGGLLIIVFVGAVTAQEYTWRTLHLWLSHGVQRPALILAKVIALALPVALIVLTPLVAGGLQTAWFSYTINGSLQLEQLDLVQFVYSILRTAYSLIPYAALTLFLAVASRSAVVAIGVGLAYSILIEGILLQLLGTFGGSLAQWGAYLPGGLGGALIALNQGAIKVSVGTQPATGMELLDPIPAAIGIAVWTVFFVVLAILSFQRQDLGQ